MSNEFGNLAIGQELRREWLVTEWHLYNPSGVDGHEVLASPMMIWEMETTCGDLVKPSLPEGKTTVGYHVDVRHIASAKPGQSIVTSARLTHIDGNKMTFAVEAREGERLIGGGRHRRAVIDVQRLD